MSFNFWKFPIFISNVSAHSSSYHTYHQNIAYNKKQKNVKAQEILLYYQHGRQTWWSEKHCTKLIENRTMTHGAHSEQKIKFWLRNLQIPWLNNWNWNGKQQNLLSETKSWLILTVYIQTVCTLTQVIHVISNQWLYLNSGWSQSMVRVS